MMKHRVLTPGSVGLAVLLAPAMALAQAPAAVPIQGVLTDGNGEVLDGAFAMSLTLYDAPVAGAAILTEVQNVTVDQGVFTVYIGENAALDLAAFVGKQPYLGIKVGADPEMSPRLRIGTVPYAAYAEHAGNVPEFPSGAVMHFDLPACPAGWSLYGAAAGRALVGMPAGGTPAGVVGMPLADLEDRAHSHAIAAASVTSSMAGLHSHTTDPVGFNVTVDPVSTMTSTSTHNHAWSTFDSVNSIWGTYNAAGTAFTMYDWDNGMDTAGVGDYPIATSGFTQTYYTDSDTHGHTVDIAAMSIPVNVGPTQSTNAPDHAHAVDVPASVSGPAAASSVMPYLQLLVCRKD